jgi:formylmethanofuran:tetrahydromethanopterin formyltransferase
MRVTFWRFPGHSSAYSVIERDDGVVYRMKEFTRAGNRLPHDLRHFVVERELGIADGIWGGIAAGMVYTSMDHVQGRRPPHAVMRPPKL